MILQACRRGGRLADRLTTNGEWLGFMEDGGYERPEFWLSDGWTAVTRDRSLSAQFEHMVGVTATGCEVFTYSPAGLHKPPYSLPA